MKKAIYIISSSIVSLVIGLYVGATYLKEDVKPVEQRLIVKKTEPKSKTVKKKQTKKQKTSTYPIKIKSIRTGFGATSRNWKPALLVNVQNMTNRDINDYIKMKAIFIDTKDGKQIGEKTKYISSEFITLLASSNKDILIVCPQGYKGSSTSLRLKARLYFQNKFLKEVKIDPTELR